MLDDFFIEMYSNKNSGTIRISFAPSIVGNGNWIIRFSFSIPLMIIFAAFSALIKNGIGNLFFSVIGVSTNPGLTVITSMLNGFNSTLKFSNNNVAAALLAQ